MDLYTLPGVINKRLFVQEAFARVSQHLPAVILGASVCVCVRERPVPIWSNPECGSLSQPHHLVCPSHPALYK